LKGSFLILQIGKDSGTNHENGSGTNLSAEEWSSLSLCCKVAEELMDFEEANWLLKRDL